MCEYLITSRWHPLVTVEHVTVRGGKSILTPGREGEAAEGFLREGTGENGEFVDVADHAAGFGAGLTGVAIEAADKEFIAIERHGGRFAGGDDFSIEIDADGVGITGHGDVVPAEWLKAGPAHGQQPPIPGGGIAEFGVEGRALDADAG